MSLLLDALKKAAEQKAQKSKEEAPVNRGSDETLLDVAAGVAERARADDDDASRPSDETDFDHSELSARIESGATVRGAADETALDMADITESRLQIRQPTSAGEETGLDIPENTDLRVASNQPAAIPAEDTGLDLPEATQTRIGPEPPTADTEDTGLEIPDVTQGRARAEAQPHDDGDETGLEAPDATQTGYREAAPVAEDNDDTGLEIPDATQTSYSEQPAAFEQGDETGIDLPDEDPDGEEAEDQSRLSEQLQTGEDETMVFPTDDLTNFVVEHEELAQLAAAQEAETDSSQPGAGDLTGIGKLADEPQIGDTDAVDDAAGEDSDAGSSAVAEDLTGISDRSAEPGIAEDLGDDDDTRLRPEEPGDEVEKPQPRDLADETDISKPGAIIDESYAEDVVLEGDPGRHGEAPGEDAEQTDFREPVVRADQVEPAEVALERERELTDEDPTQQAPIDHADSAINVADEDLSLLLLEPDPTNPRSEGTSYTDPQVTAGQPSALDTGGLGLLDMTESKLGGDPTDTQGRTVTNPSQTAIQRDVTRVADDAETLSNVPRGDATSTRTYAPDNYDRTLMKLPSDDESKLFAGMKSDSDVVMTPDYAKKVFRSKTSAQRAQHYKVYIGIGFVILLSIGIFGGMQYQQESLAIDDKLRPLKRDPMPGLIKQQQPEATRLFAETDDGTTARTIELLETAEAEGGAEAELVADAMDTAEATDGQEDIVVAGTIAGGDVVAAGGDAAPEGGDAVEAAPATAEPAQPVTEPGPTSEPQSVAAVEPEPMQTPIVVATRPDPVVEPKPSDRSPADSTAGGQVAMLTGAADEAAATDARPASSSTLQIETSSQYRQNDLWLREAYAAYQAGNNAQALRLYNQVLEADPGNRNARLARAAINLRNGAVNAAIADYQALLLANPKDTVAMTSLLSVANISPVESETQLKLMIRDEPDSPYLNFALGNAYGAQDRWPEAQRHYFQALATNPQDPNYAYNLAVSLEHIAQPGSAATYYQRALDNYDNGTATFSRDLVNQRLAVLGAP